MKLPGSYSELTRHYLESLNTVEEFCTIAAHIPYFAKTIIERDFMVGWVNAMDMLDNGEITRGDNAAFKRFALSEVRNLNQE